MGYTTEFQGQFLLNKPLTKHHKEYLEMFSESRRMQRNPNYKFEPNELNEKCVDLMAACGLEGMEFYCGNGFCGQDPDNSITEYNYPPAGQPGLWCQWVPNEEGTAIEWNGIEKFYEYVPWIKYIIENFLKPWGYVLNGEVTWEGEDQGDMGKIIIKNNVVTTKVAKVTYSYH